MPDTGLPDGPADSIPAAIPATELDVSALADACEDFTRAYWARDASETVSEAAIEAVRVALGQPAEPTVDADALREHAEDLWSSLDWTLWGHGLGDVLRERMADTMLAALPTTDLDQALQLMQAWKERRGYPVLHEQFAELRAELAEAVASREAWAIEADRLDHQVDELTADLLAERDGLADDLGDLGLLHGVVLDSEDGLRAEVARLTAGADATPAEPGVQLSPGQWIARWNAASAGHRREWARSVIEAGNDARNCLVRDHEGELADLRSLVKGDLASCTAIPADAEQQLNYLLVRACNAEPLEFFPLAEARKLLASWSAPAVGSDTDRPSIVCLCGSMRFEAEIREAAIEESVAGRVVVLPLCNMKEPHPLWADETDAERVKVELDALHRAKVDLADEVLVVAPGGYIGDSTRSEIAYAEACGKPVRYWAGGVVPAEQKVFQSESPKWRTQFRMPGESSLIEIYDVVSRTWGPTSWASLDQLAAVYGPLTPAVPAEQEGGKP